MRLRKIIPVTALFFVGASMTLAQDTPDTPYYPDDAVRKTIDLALRRIEMGKCGSAACAPATEDELANPPLTIAEGPLPLNSADLQQAQDTLAACTKARSRIMDADFAAETANLTRASILQQAGISVLAQANALPQQTLALLQ